MDTPTARTADSNGHPIEDSTYWDDRYSAPGHVPAVAPLSILTERIEHIAPGRAVDLACGTGRHARWLARRQWSVQACDFSGAAIANASSLDSAGIRYEVADARSWSPDAAVDLVLIGYLQLPVDDLFALFERASGWLTDRGRLVYVGHSREGLTHGKGGGPQNPAILPSLLGIARATAELKVNTLAHVVRPDGHTVDVMLDCERWAS